MIYTVTFNPAIDYVIQMKEFFEGKVNRTENETLIYGGKGINISVLLHTLGVNSVALGFVAGFTGRQIETGLKQQGIQTDFIHLKKGNSRINVKIKANVETEINAQGPEIQPEELQLLLDKIRALNSDDILILAGSVPSTLPSQTYETILQSLKGRNVRIIIDATKDLLLNVLKYRPFLIKPNIHELQEIFSVSIESDEDIVAYAKRLQQFGARNVLVSMAEKGSLLLDENQNTYRMGVAKGEVVNSVGAGDSMVAGFIAGYDETEDYEYALRLGTAAGSATAFSKGIAGKEQIFKLLKQLE